MPYSPEHKVKIRKTIIDNARKLFNRRGLNEVSIDQIMAASGLTRGGFYNHFTSKEELYVEAMDGFSKDRAAEMPCGSDMCGPEMAMQIFQSYVSRQHLDDMDSHCPLIALPSDVSRSGVEVRAAYQRVLEGMVGMFENNLRDPDAPNSRATSLALAATCVGAMVLSRTVNDQALADEICDATQQVAETLVSGLTPAH